MLKKLLSCVLALNATVLACAGGDDLTKGFSSPPDSARPWVYWFPLDGNISSNGITLDLEAMKRVGIGGVLYMETDQGAPSDPQNLQDRSGAACSSISAPKQTGWV